MNDRPATRRQNTLIIKWAYIVAGGVPVNEFEKDLQDTRNDFVDAANGFTFSFLFFAVLFIIGIVVQQIMK